MRQKDRISLLEGLGRYILEELEGEGSPEWNATLQRAYIENKWFTIENTRQAMKAVATRMLQPELLEAWVAPYELSDPMHPDITVGIVMAGNIPMVGFSDWLAVFVAGQRAKIKLSEKDRVLLPFLVNKLGEWEHESREYTIFCTEHEALKGFDAVIATGSNNTARYFREYFAKYPHIIRANRNAVAVLDGTETAADFFASLNGTTKKSSSCAYPNRVKG